MLERGFARGREPLSRRAEEDFVGLAKPGEAKSNPVFFEDEDGG
jgi:hypothetical protein